MTAAAMLMAASNAPLVASVSPAAYGEYACTGYPPSVCVSPQVIATDPAVVTYTGGDGSSPTYSWAWVSGDTFTVASPSSASTTFSRSTGRLTQYSGIYRCTLTVGSEVALLDVPVSTFYNYETGL